MANFLNVIIDTGHVQDTDREHLFPDEEKVLVIRQDNPKVKTIFDLLLILGAFKSKSQARKNWKHGDIQPGWNEWFVGKKKRHLCTWAPSQ